jgi:hypothetical protein
MSEVLAEQVDRLITVEMRSPGFMRGIIPAYTNEPVGDWENP